MDIQLTEEQELLRSSIQRFLREQYDFDERRKIIASEEGWSRRHWKSFAELGLCAAPFREGSGGLGGGSLATMIVMQEFGRNLVVEPYFETIVLAGGLIEDVGSAEQREAFLPKIMECCQRLVQVRRLAAGAVPPPPLHAAKGTILF